MSGVRSVIQGAYRGSFPDSDSHRDRRCGVLRAEGAVHRAGLRRESAAAVGEGEDFYL